jgi:hypothetical protein
MASMSAFRRLHNTAVEMKGGVVEWQTYVCYFFGGIFLVNSVPHFTNGVSGRRFPTIFASLLGKRQSSPTVNVLWGDTQSADRMCARGPRGRVPPPIGHLKVLRSWSGGPVDGNHAGRLFERIQGKSIGPRGWRYNVTTGKVLHVPDYGVTSYPVKVVDGKIMVALDPSPAAT